MSDESKLTEKQEKFAQYVASGMSQSDAYRNSTKLRTSTTDKTVHEEASKIAALPKVATRIRELREPVVKMVRITLESHLATLAEIRDRALNSSQFSAASTAEIARGKACGLYTEKVEHTGADGTPISHNLVVSFVGTK